MMHVIFHECQNCGRDEERIFTDSFSGKELCIPCLVPIANVLALSPQSEGDNLEELLEDMETREIDS